MASPVRHKTTSATTMLIYFSHKSQKSRAIWWNKYRNIMHVWFYVNMQHRTLVIPGSPMGLLLDKWTYRLRMRRECRERFPSHRLKRKPLVSDPGMHQGTCVTHVLWSMSGSLTRGARKRSRYSRRMHNPQFYISNVATRVFPLFAGARETGWGSPWP